MSIDLRDWYGGRRVFVTGHTGFKGAWLIAWLQSMDAIVTGYSSAPEGLNLFDAAELGNRVESVVGDVRNRDSLRDALAKAQPEMVLHLAAQALVRRSYRDPVLTYETNVLGTMNVLDVVRQVTSVKAVIVVTSDKCYEPNGDHPHREGDPLGGLDPYSSSKACAELATTAMRQSFFLDDGAAVASARAGNVIGGGDWSEDRLVPDLMRAAAAGETAVIRNPDFVRPWQFVLEPLRGYLMLGRSLVDGGREFAEAWNFGPDESDAASVRDVTERVRQSWNRAQIRVECDQSAPAEAPMLRIDSSKARERLAWRPALSLADTVELTVRWYREFYENGVSAARLVDGQLREYESRVDVDAS